MALTKREKYIATGVGAAAALFILNQLVINPYFVSINQLSTQIDEASRLKTNNETILFRQRKLAKVWTGILASGLTDDLTDVAQQSQGAVLEWARAADINLTEVKPERTTDAGPFQVSSLHVTGSGSTPQLRRFLMSFEASKLPVRIVEVQISPSKEGTDDLTIQMSISTLSLKPTVDTPDSTSASAGRNGANQTWN